MGTRSGDARVQASFGPEGLDELIGRLRASGYVVIGPTVTDGAIVYGAVSSIAQLPRGWTERQEKGTYRLQRRGDSAFFGYTVGPTSWKTFLFPPREKLWSGARRGATFRAGPAEPVEGPYAFLGVRGCDWNAIAIQDRVFLGGTHRDERYGTRRDDAIFIGVQCTVAAPTCFCTSMGTGPALPADKPSPDVILTEICEGDQSRFVAEARTGRGEELLRGLGATAAEAERQGALAAVEACRREVESKGRSLDPQLARLRLVASPEHPHWDDVAQRCINCANCTLVCPTCFCSSVEEVTDLAGDHAERWRRWDSCFTLDHSHLHGGSVRVSARSRYRQWMTHKLSTWWDQFDTSGCTGCGRCISWCPVGIDITEEANAVIGAENRSQKGMP